MRAQSVAINNVLTTDNTALEQISNMVNKVGKENELEGASWNAMKELIRNHDAVIKSIILANRAFENANNLVSSKIGNEELIRAQIQDNIDKLQKSINNSKSMLQSIPKIPRVPLNVDGIMNSTIQTMNLNLEAIKHLSEKLKRMDQIERDTKGLYKEAHSLYKEAKKGMELLTNSWNGTRYISPGHSDWASKIHIRWVCEELKGKMDVVLDRIVKRDENGKVLEYDQVELVRILGKNSNEITKEEYVALAYIASTTDNPEVLQTIVNGCYNLKGQPKEHTDGWMITSVVVENERTEKLSKILQEIKNYKSGLYIIAGNVSEKERVELYKAGAFGRIEQNKEVFESLLAGPEIISVVSRKNIQGFHQSLTDGGVSIGKDENGNFIVTYCEGGHNNVTYDAYQSKVHKVVISPMSIGDTCADKANEEDISWHEEQLGMTSKESLFKRINTPTNMVMTKALKEGIENARGISTISKIFVAADVIRTLDRRIQKEDAYEDVTKAEDMKRMIRHFNLYGVRITHTVGGKSKLEYKISIGLGDWKKAKSMRQILENLDKNLSEGGAYENVGKKVGYNSKEALTINDILDNPNKVIEFQKKLEKACYDSNGNSIDVGEIYNDQENK